MDEAIGSVGLMNAARGSDTMPFDVMAVSKASNSNIPHWRGYGRYMTVAVALESRAEVGGLLGARSVLRTRGGPEQWQAVSAASSGGL